MTSSSPLIIVGMHRSKTSLTASWVHFMGLNLGNNLIGPGIGNDKGHFEDMDFHDFHESVFRNHGIEYAALKFPIDFELSNGEHERLVDLINSKKKNNIQWGWKEPRTSLFLDHYHNELPAAKYIILYRPCNEVVDSLLRRDVNKEIKKYAEKNIIHQLKYEIRKRSYGKLIVKNNIDNYIRIWAAYNRKIKDLINMIDPSDYMLLDQSSLINSDNNIFDKLIQWGYNLEYVPISKIIDKSLFNDISVKNYYDSNYPDVELLSQFFEEKIKSDPGY